MNSRKVSLQELYSHKTKKDVWIAVKGKVYDITGYLDDHPGGEQILLEVGGSDASTAFEDVGHSQDAKEKMQSLLVGDLEGYEAPGAKHVFVSSTADLMPELPARGNFRLSMSLIMAAIAVVMLGISWKYLAHLLPASDVIPLDLGFFSQGAAMQLLISFIAVSSLTTLTATFIKIKKTLDLDYELDHYKPYLQSARIFHGAPSYRSRPPVLDSETYNAFPLIDRKQLSPNVYLFKFSLPHPSDSLELPVGRHVVIQADIGGKSVSRSYTPTSRNENLGSMDLLIKVYPNGLIGNYLLDLPLGKSVNVRGPAGRFRYNRFLCKHLGCIAGGSGITPMLQIIRAVCEDRDDETAISLLYANQTENDILARQELEHYARKYASKFSLRFWLDRPPQNWEGGSGFITKEDIQTYLPPIQDGSKYLICGPPPMVNAMKRNFVALGCDELKAVTGMNDQIYIF